MACELAAKWAEVPGVATSVLTSEGPDPSTECVLLDTGQPRQQVQTE